jgi:hypothetical protein
MSKIFRNASMDKISSPEKLDTMVKLTSARTWFLIVFFLLITLSLVIWGFFGTIPKTVSGRGVIINGGGTYNIQSTSNGVITDISVENGDIVNKGDVIGRTYDKNVFNELKQVNEKITLIDEQIKGANAGNNVVLEQQLNISLSDLNIEAEGLKDKLMDNKILAPTNGEIIEVLINKNDFVQIGQSVCSILETSKLTLEDTVVAFIPVAEGQIIRPGMKMNVYITVFNKQEYGHMEAVVIEVSDYVVSRNAIEKRLGSDELTDIFSSMGALVEIKANLKVDKDTKSGYYWSSIKGKEVDLPRNAICEISVTIEENRPIDFLNNLLKLCACYWNIFLFFITILVIKCFAECRQYFSFIICKLGKDMAIVNFSNLYKCFHKIN